MTAENMNAKDRIEGSRFSTGIVILLSAIPVISAIVYGAVDSASIGLLSIPLTFIVVLWVAHAWQTGEFPRSTDSLQIPLLGLIALACVHLLPFGPDSSSGLLAVEASQTISMDPYATRFFLIRLVLFFVFFAAALVFIPQGARPSRLVAVIIVFGAAFAFFGILQRLATPESIYGLRPTPQAIPFASYVNQHHFAGLMEMTSGVALGLLFGRGLTRERKLFVAIAAGIMGMAIVFTGSRGGLISYLAVIVFAAAASFARRRARRGEGSGPGSRSRNLLIITAAVGLIVIVLGSVLLLGGEGALLRGIGLQTNQSDLSSGRAHFWRIAWQIFLENPILGAGFDAFGVAFTRHDTWHGLFRVEQAHNDYLQMLADGGIVGFACVAGFVYLLLRKGVRAMASETDDLRKAMVTGALAGCFGVLIHSFFDFPLRTPANMFFFLLLVVIAVGGQPARRHTSATASGP